MKKSLSLWVFVLFAVSILTVQFIYAEAPASPDDTKVTKKIIGNLCVYKRRRKKISQEKLQSGKNRENPGYSE